jgi:hypothetical protein
MEKINLIAKDSLRWVAAGSSKGDYNLLCLKKYGALFKEEVAGTFSLHNSMGRASAKLFEKEYIIHRSRFLRTRISIREIGSKKEAAKLKINSIGEGSLELTEGSKYKWILVNLWNSHWAFTDKYEDVICGFRKNTVLLNENAKTDSENKENEALPLLILLGWSAIVSPIDDDTQTIIGNSFIEAE